MQDKGYDFLRQLDQLLEEESVEVDVGFFRLRQILGTVTKDLLVDEGVALGRLFDRLVYLFNKYPVYAEQSEVHSARKTSNKVVHQEIESDRTTLNKHVHAIKRFISFFYGIESLAEHKRQLPVPSTEQIISDNFAQGPWRCVVTQVNGDELSFTANVVTDSNDTHELLEFKIEKFYHDVLNNNQSNLIYTDTIRGLDVGDELNLLRIFPREGYYVPMHIVYYPDYLVNVTSIANSVLDFTKDTDNWKVHYLYNLFCPLEPNPYFLRGNLVNDLMDELILRESAEPFVLMDWFATTFKKYSLEYSVFTKTGELERLGLSSSLRTHYQGVKNALAELRTKGVDLNKVEIEPSFIQPVYGLQGRLDLMHLNNDRTIEPRNHRLDIVELKTSKVYGAPYKPDNAAQVTLYDLLLRNVGARSVSANTTRIKGMRSLLYSGYPDEALRDRPPSFLETQFVIALRNQFVKEERLLAFSVSSEEVASLLIEYLSLPVRGLSRFDQPRFEDWRNRLTGSSELIRSYLGEFAKFALREKWYAKMGNSRSSRSDGYRQTWLRTLQEKKEDCTVIADLTLLDLVHDDRGRVQHAIMKRAGNDLGNDSFKVGDIIYMFEQNNKGFNVASSLIPAVIKELGLGTVTVAIGQVQKGLSDRLERSGQRWVLEHRLFESSYRLMLNNLYTLTCCTTEKQNLLLGVSEPRMNNDPDIQEDGLTEQQLEVVNGALKAQDYYLIHGVPGSGKTSRVIKTIVKHEALRDGDVLLLAYTNKAADKLSEVMSELNEQGHNIPFFRLGRLDAMSEGVRDAALETQTANISDREQMHRLVDSARVVISTVAGLTPSHILLRAKDFRCAIVDEASQILEPTIVGILTKVKKFVLVGDHKQLPAINLHVPEDAKLHDDHILTRELGIGSLGNSYFERIFERAQEKGWKVTGALTGQGRMHEEIMRFPSYVFYGGALSILNEQTQRSELTFTAVSPATELEKRIGHNRILFIHTPRELRGSLKTNSHEAKMVGDVIESIIRLSDSNINVEEEIGVITPFRNQRGAIRQELLKRELPGAEGILIDTVESFQGSEKEHIIISFSVNDPVQLQMIMEWDAERRVDRKLNVALTRAKKQLIMVGNCAVLEHEKLYGNLVEYCRSYDLYYDPQVELSETHEGSSVISERFFHEFDGQVTDRIKADARTVWHQIILGENSFFHRSRTIEGGKADFRESLRDHNGNEWSQEDRVLVYCYYNMRIHYHSSRWIYEQFLADVHVDHFFDIGCGPGTSSLAFSEEHSDTQKYYLVDIAPAMLSKASEFLSMREVNHETYENMKDIVLDEVSGVALMNFSFLFANVGPSFIEDLLAIIHALKGKCSRVILVNQNSPNSELNVVWDKFCSELKDIGFDLINGSSNLELNYSHQPNDTERGKSTELSYAVLSN